MLEPLGLAAGPVVPTREWRELYAALDCAVVAAIHPFYTASMREFAAAGRPIVGSAPVGFDGTAAWLSAIGKACGGRRRRGSARRKTESCPPSRAALAKSPIRGRITAVGIRRLGVAGRAAVDRERRRRALRRYRLSAHRLVGPRPRMAGSQRACTLQYRASLEQDLAAMHEFSPNLAIGTTPVVQKAKELAIPALYFTNLISARPLMGPAGAGSLAQVVNAALGNQARFDEMSEFFEGVGDGLRRRRVAGIARRPAAVPRALQGAARETRRQAQSRGDGLMLVLDHDRAGGYWGCGVRVHGDQGSAGHHRRSGGLRESAGDLGAALHRWLAAARVADRRDGPGRRGTRPARHRRRDEARPQDLESGSARGGGHRLHRGDDRRRRDARRHQYPALSAAHHR